jgi:hypothetical protein
MAVASSMISLRQYSMSSIILVSVQRVSIKFDLFGLVSVILTVGPQTFLFLTILDEGISIFFSGESTGNVCIIRTVNYYYMGVLTHGAILSIGGRF